MGNPFLDSQEIVRLGQTFCPAPESPRAVVGQGVQERTASSRIMLWYWYFWNLTRLAWPLSIPANTSAKSYPNSPDLSISGSILQYTSRNLLGSVGLEISFSHVIEPYLGIMKHQFRVNYKSP